MSTKVEELLNKLNNGETITDYKSNSRLEDHLLACINGTGKEGLGEPKSKIEELLQVHAEQMAGNAGGGGGATISYGGEPTPIVCDGVTVIDKIYSNTSKSVQEVDTILSQLTYIENFPESGMNGYMLFVDGDMSSHIILIMQTLNAFGDGRNVYSIVDLAANVIFYQNYTNDGSAELGWVTEDDGYINCGAPEYQVGMVSIGDMQGIPVGAQNELLASIIAANDSFGSSTEIKLSGNYDGATVTATDDVDLTEYINNKQLPLKIKVNGITELINHNISTVSSDEITTVKSGTFMEQNSNTACTFTKASFPNATIIESYAFYNCANLVELDMPNLKIIYEYGLYSCSSLKDIDWTNVLSVYRYGCYYTTSFTNINAPKLTYLDKNGYQFCGSDITRFEAQNYDESIPEHCFENCDKLTEVILPNSTGVASYAFRNCKALVNVDIPKTKQVNSYAFKDCILLKTLNIPLASTINEGAFKGCHEFETLITKDDSIVLGGSGVFKDCYKLKNIGKISSRIYNGSFANCYSLESVYLNSYNTIESNAFHNCKSLKKIFVPCSMNSSGEIIEKYCDFRYFSYKVFEGCCHFEGTVDGTYNPNGDKDGYLYVPAQLLANYKRLPNLIYYDSQIVGHQDFVTGDELPNYSNDTYTTCTWYSDEAMTTVVTTVDADGKYYCRLEA